MIGKLALAGALALAPLESNAGLPPPTTFTYHPYVHRVDCDEGRGTAFQIAPGRLVSVNHVTKLHGCTVNGKLITLTHSDPLGDFSLSTTVDKRAGGIAVRCDGYRDGEWVFAIGHARGLPIPQIMALRYSKRLTDLAGGRWAVLVGYPYKVIPGMSGGPILDAWGRVVGVVNAYSPLFPISFSRQLRDTTLCA